MTIFITSQLHAEIEVTSRNVHNFLEIGEMSYTINVNFSRISWKPQEQYQKEIRKAEEDIERNREDLNAVIEYIRICNEAGRNDLAKEMAERYTDPVFQDYVANKDEESASRLVIVTNESGSKESYFKAYEAIRPFLEQGTAVPETVYAAIQNRELADDRNLGFRIAEFYQQIYPDDAELYYRWFMLTLNNSLNNTLPYMISAIYSQMEDLEGYLQQYFAALEQSVYLDLLDQALANDPDNYQYLLASVGFRAMVRWFSLLGTMMQEENLEMNTLQDLFTLLNFEQDTQLKEDLQKGLTYRPEEDIQIYLAAALFHATDGDARRTAEYVRKALQIRPDLPEIYNAHVFSVLLEVAAKDRDPGPAERAQIEKILLDKIQMTGKNAYDLYVLAVMKFLQIRDGGTERQRVRYLEEMKGYTEESLAESDSILGRLAEGNIALMENRIDDALDIYNETLMRGADTMEYAFHANIGVAYFMKGNAEMGKKQIQIAADLLQGDLKAAVLLNEQ